MPLFGNQYQQDDDQFDRMYTLYFPKLVRFSQTYLLNREEAENIVQDIFLKLYQNRSLIPYEGNINAFLFTIVKNKSIDILRKLKSSMVSNLDIEVVNQNLFSLQKFDENNFSLDEIETIIDDAVSSLPERCQMIFRMSKMEGLSYKQISDKLGISTNTIEGQMNIALKKLRVILKNYLPLYVMII